jgi:hypothetical protein
MSRLLLELETELVGQHAKVLRGLEQMRALPQPPSGGDLGLRVDPSLANEPVELRLGCSNEASALPCGYRVSHAFVSRWGTTTIAATAKKSVRTIPTGR